MTTTSIIITCIILSVVFLCIFGFIAGEEYVKNNENTKFSRWWRRHICAPDPNE
jgi:hypothetical protein